MEAQLRSVKMAEKKYKNSKNLLELDNKLIKTSLELIWSYVIQRENVCIQ